MLFQKRYKIIDRVKWDEKVHKSYHSLLSIAGAYFK